MPFQILINSINPAYYEQVFDFRIIDYNRYEISFEQNGAKQIKRGEFDKDLVDVDLNLRINRQDNFSEKATESLKYIFYQFVIHSHDYLISNIRGNLSVTNPEYTQILKVDLKDVIPERAVLILDTLNSVYAESKLKTKYELNERTIAYIDRQLNE